MLVTRELLARTVELHLGIRLPIEIVFGNAGDVSFALSRAERRIAI